MIQPVFLHYQRLAGLALSRRERPIVAWYGDMAFLPHLLGLLASGGLVATSITASRYRVASVADRKILARADRGGGAAARRGAPTMAARRPRYRLFLPSPYRGRRVAKSPVEPLFFQKPTRRRGDAMSPSAVPPVACSSNRSDAR